MNSLQLDALLTGRALPFTRPGSRSGIAKAPRQEALAVTTLGLAGDEQGDLRVHGGAQFGKIGELKKRPSQPIELDCAIAPRPP